MSNELKNFNWKQKAPKIDVERYLRRIGYEAPSLPNLHYLKNLHKHHLFSIPFENLDIHWNKEITLEIEKIYRKIVINRRGGFCYELNGLFHALLLNLGFDCHLVSCRVFNEEGHESAEFDHMAIIVELDGESYLTDVGFGDLFLEPKKLVVNQMQVDYNKYFRFLRDTNGDYILSYSTDASDFKKQYIFSIRKRQFIEFMSRCHWQQTSDESHFTKNKMCSIATSEGRLTLTDDKLIETTRGEKKETPLLNADDFNSKLHELFGIAFQVD